MGPRQRRTRSVAKTHTAPVILVSILGFLAIAGVAFAIGMVANVNRWLSDLPDYTDADQYLVSEPTSILDANGNEIASLYVQNRETVTIDQVSQYVLDGTVATEDERFYEHPGVDIIGIARAVVAQLTGGSEGGSTLTQQLVRNTILSEEQFDQTIERKVREAWVALKMEEIFSKEEILMMYLNTIYYGHGAYGIQAAAKTYYSKNANELTLAEAAMLVGLPNAPSLYDPTVNYDYALSRRNTVLDRMLRNGYITQEEHDAAQAEEITLNLNEMPENGALAYPYFVDYVKSLLQEEFSTDMIFKGGLTVKTTIDPTMQAEAEKAAVGQLDAVDADYLDVGMVSLDPKTGYIKAMVGGKNYDDAEGAHTNHTLTRRSAGSSFKGLTLAAAVKAGMNPSISLNCSSPMTFTIDGQTFEIQNYGNTNYGVRTLADATAVSSNTGYIQVQEAIGYNAIKDMCEKLGIDTEDPVAEFVGQHNLTLGTCYLTPLEMAEAYATFANGGYHREAVAITEILSRDGETLYKHEDKAEQVLTAGEAAAVTDALERVLTSGTGKGFYPNINLPVAGKTGSAGTATNGTDLWFVGYTPTLCTAIWYGRSGNNEGIGNIHTADLPLPAFYNYMNALFANATREEFPTGDAPSYKPNSEWKFSKTATVTKKDGEDDENETDEEKSEDKGKEPSNNSSSNSNQNQNPNPTPTPAPEPDPEPEPTPTPEPEPEPEPDPVPEPDPLPTPGA